MDYSQFKDIIVERIKDYLPETYSDYEVSINPVTKNNGVKLDGLIIKSSDSNICPNIYLNPFFSQYESGRDFKDILHDIAFIRINSCEDAFPDVSNLTKLERIRKTNLCTMYGIIFRWMRR